MTRSFDPVHHYLGQPPSPPFGGRGTVLECLDHQVRCQAAAPFLTTVSPDGGRTTLSYGEVDRASRALAGWLLTEAGLHPDLAVGFAPRNDSRSVVAILALLRAGCRILLVNPADPPARVEQQATQIGVTAWVRHTGAAPTGIGTDITVPDAAPADRGYPLPALDPFSDALYFGTSGSTAASKLVAQSHVNAAANAAAVIRHHRLRPGDRLLACLPIHHVNGLHFTVFAAAAAGTHVLLLDGFDPFGYGGVLEIFQPRIASVVPSILEALAASWRLRTPPPGLDYFVSAAAPLAAATAGAVLGRIGTRVVQGYGLTETTNFSTTLPTDVDGDEYRRLMVDVEIPTVGTAVLGNEVAVLRGDGTRADPGEVGEICMRGHNVMSRYVNNAEATEAAFRHGWFHSQDLGAERTDPGTGRSYLVITGRQKNIAKVRGEAVSLDEMERVLRTVGELRDAACVAVPDRFLGERVVAVVAWRNGTTGPDGILWARLRAHFAETSLPSRIVPVTDIPRTATGKLLRPQLTARVEADGL
ncbi:class I adenylate-forming enzyme family protein [Longispora urticae]